MLNALFGFAYELETPFFPQLAAPNVAPKTTHIELAPCTSYVQSDKPISAQRQTRKK